MGPLPLGILIGCLNGLRWLLWLVAMLLVILAVTESYRQQPDAMPGAQLVLALGFFIGGALSAWFARVMTPK
jgi:hypothetical protein